mgnify:CR=1 FL=1
MIKSFLTYSGSDYISFKNALLEVVDKEITGVVWEDFNFDGIMDSDESKISAVSLKLYNSSDELLQTTTPDDKGKYVFTGLSEGSYYVVAEFNTDKYGLTNSPSDNFYDKSRLSVFKAEKVNNNSSESLISKTETKEEDKKDRLETVLYNLLESIRVCANHLTPFLTNTSKEILKQLNTTDTSLEFKENNSYNNMKPEVLFQ